MESALRVATFRCPQLTALSASRSLLASFMWTATAAINLLLMIRHLLISGHLLIEIAYLILALLKIIIRAPIIIRSVIVTARAARPSMQQLLPLPAFAALEIIYHSFRYLV